MGSPLKSDYFTIIGSSRVKKKQLQTGTDMQLMLRLSHVS